jgi:hypothetical protein
MDQPFPAAHASTASADVVFSHDQSFHARTGRVLSRAGAAWTLELSAPPPGPLEVDTRVVLDVAGAPSRKFRCAVTRAEGRTLELQQLSELREDKRVFPRHYGAITLLWRPLRDAATTDWREPDPFMSFSVGGLSFGVSEGAARDGELIELDFAVALSDVRHRAVARVLRSLPRAPNEVFGSETHDLAVAFVELAAEGRDALADFTLRIQRALARAD